MERPVNWGILSAGLISQDFANALILNCPGAVVYAVGARSQEKADEFGKKFGCQACYSSYEALVQDPKVGMCLDFATISGILIDVRYHLCWYYPSSSQSCRRIGSKKWKGSIMREAFYFKYFRIE
jgi:hypothetical protein